MQLQPNSSTECSNHPQLSPTTVTAHLQLWGLGLIVLLTLAAYRPALSGDFIWDDDDYVWANPTLRNLEGLSQIWSNPRASPQYYPLVFTSFWVEYQIWALQPIGYHLVNVFLHALNAVLLWLVLCRLSIPGALLAAGIFALHPVHVESVAWITERKNVLSGTFYLAAALAYLRFDRLSTAPSTLPHRWHFYGLALGLFACALLSKTVTCSLPAAILLLIWWKRNRLSQRDASPLIPFLAVGACFGLLTVWLERYHVQAEGADWALSFLDRCLIAGRALWFYVFKLAWPQELIFIYPRWTIDSSDLRQYVFPAGAIAMIGILWHLRWRFGSGPLVAILFFGGTLTPALGFIDVYPMRFSFVADHFQYLASIGPIVLASATVAIVAKRFSEPVLKHHSDMRYRSARNKVQATLFIMLLITLALMVWNETNKYQNSESLWLDTLDKNPNAFLAHNNLGTLRYRNNRLEEAMAHYTKAIQINPEFTLTHFNLGTILAKRGQTDRAIQHFNKALQIEPDNLDVHRNLAIVFSGQGKRDQAGRHFALEQAYLAHAFAKDGLFTKAALASEQAIRLAAESGEAELYREMRRRLKAYRSGIKSPDHGLPVSINLGITPLPHRRDQPHDRTASQPDH